jgi:hypothetical protein
MNNFLNRKGLRLYLVTITLSILLIIIQVASCPCNALAETSQNIIQPNNDFPPFEPTGSFELTFMPRGTPYLTNDGTLYLHRGILFKAKYDKTGTTWLNVTSANTVAFFS